MGITLTDLGNEKNLFFVNFWNWRAIGEAIRTLGVVSDDRASALQEPFCGNGLTREEALQGCRRNRSQGRSALTRFGCSSSSQAWSWRTSEPLERRRS